MANHPRTNRTMPTDLDVFMRSAYWLVDSAAMDYNGGTINGKWVNSPECLTSKDAYDEKMMLVKRLREPLTGFENTALEGCVRHMHAIFNEAADRIEELERQCGPEGGAMEKALLSFHPKMNYTGDAVLLILRSCVSLAKTETSSATEGREG